MSAHPPDKGGGGVVGSSPSARGTLVLAAISRLVNLGQECVDLFMAFVGE